ncbi:response regulator containing a CheY-like receiver domain and an HTH DNA-binding domain [Serratia sp. FGI94]|uniref:helix-turn-helix transcriptional regulator n=1 Tax=Serratia sp. FGI94 TaxID=671990 RepID=UPI0002A6F925|nr:response regulator transcription factor [Serratia sp. FGI94]AGB81731.1 response regulator containing a CheY-like receiver domain and an HTH DNA-binding domain [Serratia sp. FGI94]
MKNNDQNRNFILYDAMPWVGMGLEAFLRPLSTVTQSVASLSELKTVLSQQPRQTVIMELYGAQECLYDGLYFILHEKAFWPNTPWIVLTDIKNHSVLRLLSSSPDSVLVSKCDGLAAILDGISAAHHGVHYLSPTIRRCIAGRQKITAFRQLSDSEWRILALMAAGFSVKSIATATYRSYKTVSTHKLNIMHKLGLNQCGFIHLLLSLRTRWPC